MALAETLMERRKKAALEEIARAALELCVRDGFDSTSVESIAAAAGCSPRTVYRYFGTKEDMLFHDLPAAIEHLREVLETQLAAGLEPWAAVSEAVIDFIARFDVDAEHRRIPSQQMHLWLTEPALRAKYMQFVLEAEQVISQVLCRHRGTAPEGDEEALLIAVAAIGATRAVMFTHGPTRERQPLTKHLRDALATLGGGLADGDKPRRTRRKASASRAA